jgi:ABC-type enterobactin transport system permease subunit
LLVASFALYVTGLQGGVDPNPIQSVLIGIGVCVFLATFVAALILRIPIKKIPPRDAWEAAIHAATTYHRRYVVPEADLDEECLTVWMREIEAANEIARSGVVGQGVIDSVQVAAVLPHHLWEVTERLAQVSGPPA